MSATHLSSPNKFKPLTRFNGTFKDTLTADNDSLGMELAFLNRAAGWSYNVQQGCKRALDLLLAVAGLILISPLILAICLLIRLDSDGPIFYKSPRIGRNYQPFDMYKFRTMQVNADALRDALRKEAQLEGNLFKLKDDPRITRIGKFLRAFSLDELPQLINVIKGDMSLVGPRPLPPDESEMFEEPYTLRYHVTPGITGAWQVSGRSALDFQDLCQLELSYVTRWNLGVDIQILLKTLPAVLLKSGAY